MLTTSASSCGWWRRQASSSSEKPIMGLSTRGIFGTTPVSWTFWGKSFGPFWTSRWSACLPQSSLCLLGVVWDAHCPVEGLALEEANPFSPYWRTFVISLAWWRLQSTVSSRSSRLCRDRDHNGNGNICLWTACWDLLSTCWGRLRPPHPWFASGLGRSG